MKIRCKTCKRELDPGEDRLEAICRRVQTHCDKTFHHRHTRVELEASRPLLALKLAIDYPRIGEIAISRRSIVVEFIAPAAPRDSDDDEE